MFKKGITIVLTFLLVLPVLFRAIPAYSNDEQVIIKVENLNVREGPGLTYGIIGSVQKGESYKVMERKEDWIKISLPKNRSGWVANWLVEETRVKTAQSNQAVVTVDGLRIRKGPGIHFGVIGFVNQDQYVTVLNSVEGWVNISSNNVNGWVSKDFLKFMPTQEEVKTPSNLTGTITVNRLNVRNEPSLSSSVIGKLNEGEEVRVQQVGSDWVKIEFNETKAWVSADYVLIKEKEENSNNDSEQIEEEEDIEVTNPDQPSSEEEKTEPPTSDQTVEQPAVVTASILNVREEGSLSSNIMDNVANGEKVTIIEEQNNWNKIRYQDNKIGWVAGWFLEKVKNTPSPEKPATPEEQEEIMILYNGTNIRGGPATSYPVVQRANQGQTFKIVSKVGDWYEIEVTPQNQAYVAGWIVSSSNAESSVEKTGEAQYLTGKIIVIDAGHGGEDRGTTGSSGTLEKKLTARTSELLAEKLRSAGAKVVLTRSDDRYLSLRSRVSLAHYYYADVFISLHYDSFQDSSVNGITSYYYNSTNKALAQMVQSEMIGKTKLNDRGARFGNYFVLRENKQPAILLELGYLSNPMEEVTVQTSQYQEQVTSAIYYGLAKYFKSIKR
ncbi:SH3 domain-containing protein [Bacillus carboniphilus]|uniref:SH3 domain-containing protein n=1 Tax=Bacillus carboniphilus TaxID=86663 RepID=A0ABN0WE59_9BACI